MRKENRGFEIEIRGGICEISNKYGIHSSMSIDEEIENEEEFIEKKLKAFLITHEVKEYERIETERSWFKKRGLVKRVAFDAETKEYIQLQAIKYREDDCFVVQMYDNELVFMGEIWSGCKYQEEVLDWMRTNYEIEKCLTAEVYRSELGDCTNGGISSNARELYILATTKGPFEPDDIRKCVYIEQREIMGEKYVNCKPAYFRRRWYMAGGNFLYTSDSRFKEITKLSYPIAIHDRYEGR